MKQKLTWLTNQVNRRDFLRRTAAGTFGVLAGLSIGKTGPLNVFATTMCTGPYGSGQCPWYACGSGSYSWECTGSSILWCEYSTTDTCKPTSDQCNADGNCWHPCGYSCTCCDCYCCDEQGACGYCFCSNCA